MEFKDVIEANPTREQVDLRLEFILRQRLQRAVLGDDEPITYCSKCKMPIIYSTSEGWKSCCGKGVFTESL